MCMQAASVCTQSAGVCGGWGIQRAVPEPLGLGSVAAAAGSVLPEPVASFYSGLAGEAAAVARFARAVMSP